MDKEQKIFNKKMKRAGLLVLIAIASCLISIFCPPVLSRFGCSEKMIKGIKGILAMVYCVGGIVGICKFAKAVHDPLTEEEAKELKKREYQEKLGQK